MIQEMERAIVKREQIAVRYKGKSEAAAGRVTKGRGGMLATGDGKAGGLGDLTATALKKKVRFRPLEGSVYACTLCVRARSFFVHVTNSKSALRARHLGVRFGCSAPLTITSGFDSIPPFTCKPWRRTPFIFHRVNRKNTAESPSPPPARDNVGTTVRKQLLLLYYKHVPLQG